MDEAGLPGFHVSVWSALWVPKGTPKDVIAKLNAAVREALADPAVQKRYAELGLDIPAADQQTPEALRAHQKAEVDKWWPMIKAANIKPDVSGRSGAWSMKQRWLLAAFALAVCGLAGASAQDYPNRPITVIVPFPAGGPTDAIIRNLGERMRVVARPAAGGRIRHRRRRHRRHRARRARRAGRLHHHLRALRHPRHQRRGLFSCPTTW